MLTETVCQQLNTSQTLVAKCR